MKWPENFRVGWIPNGTFSESDRDVYLYSQWLADLQLNNLRKSFAQQGIGLYMDMPLGTHPDGFDCWFEPEVFANKVKGGAPPDGFFTEGQDWGFQPSHPEQTRQNGHQYFRQIVKKMTSCSSMVRIDHAMSLQRLYWIPEGFQATEGLYVHYPTDELFAVLMLESQRQKCPLVGEDLGTVTPEIRERLEKHGIIRMYVGQFECSPESVPPFNQPGKGTVTSLNTHDTPTATAFWLGLDIDLRREMNLLDEHQYQQEQHSRAMLRKVFSEYFGCTETDIITEKTEEVLKAWMLELAQSPAQFFLVNLEDLWLEKLPQNVPGTGHERPNWQRRSALSLEEIQSDPRVVEFLKKLDLVRKMSSSQ
jgi:4-alpha-glucanotransferase